MLPGGIEMQRAGHEFLAGSAFALNENRAIRIGHLGDEVVDFLHLRARADDVFKPVLFLDDLPQVPVFPNEALVIERALDGDLELVHLERLGDVIVGAELHRLKGRFHRLIGRNQDDRSLGQHLAAFAENVEAADLVHPEVGDDQLGRVVARFSSAFWPEAYATVW